MKIPGFIVFSTLLLAGCKEHRPQESFVPDTGNADTTAVADRKYKGVRVYQGNIPCADCAGIEQQLVLKGDTSGIYRLKEVYRNATEDGDSELISSGEWRRMRSGNSYVYYLSEKNITDSIRIIRYRQNGQDITMLDTQNDSIRSENRYRLKLVREN